MKTTEFEFDIGSSPMPTDPIELRGKARDQARMVVLDRDRETIEHLVFSDIQSYLRPGDLLVLNDSYMLSNTLVFMHAGEPTQLIVYGHESDGCCMAEVRPQNIAHVGLQLQSKDKPDLTCTLLESYPDNIWKVRFDPNELLIPTLEAFGTRSDETVPLNPDSWQNHREAYRSVYAAKPGSLEIPSAGLHFSQELLDRIVQSGVELAYITLHVGATEVLAVRHIETEQVEDHKVREEYFEVSEEAATKINTALAGGRRIVAVGTTVVRTLETIARRDRDPVQVEAGAGWTDLYIYPGHDFAVVGAVLTNLHRSRSSHIVLTAAIAGHDLVMQAYDEILADGGYQFDMFGDSMLIL